MAIPINPGNYSGLAALASQTMPNYNFPINGTSPLGSLFSGLAAGRQQAIENDQKQQQIDVQGRYADIASRNSDLQEQQSKMQQAQMAIEQMSKLEESKLNQITGLSAAGIIRLESAKSPEELEIAKNDIISMSVGEGVLTEDQAKAFMELSPQQLLSTLHFYYQTGSKGAELKNLRGDKDKGVGGSTVTLPDGTVIQTQTPTDPTMNEAQKSIVSNEKILSDVEVLEEQFNSFQKDPVMKGFLTVKGRHNLAAANASEDYEGYPIVGSVVQKGAQLFTGMSKEEQKEYIQKGEQFNTTIEQLFNAYRVEVTGAAAALAELDRLQKSYLNKEINGEQFIGRAQAIVDKAKRENKIDGSVLTQGVPVYKYKDVEYNEQDIQATIDHYKSKGQTVTREQVLKAMGAK